MSRRSSTGSEKAAASRKGVRNAKRRAGGRVLHLDAFSGIAGNMFLGALLDLGLSRRELEADLAGLGVEHSLRVRKVKRGALAARHLEVRVPGAGRKKRKARRDQDHSHDHSQNDSHEHGRSYAQIRALLEKARLADSVRARALAIFEALGRAEARVHGCALDEVHFHEVGAVDAIVDVTGAAIGLQRLGIERVTCTPLALGYGAVDTAHGRLPLPAPATLELLRGIPTVPAHVEWETVTPTGAAIARVIVDEFQQLPAMRIEAVGHGAGEDMQAVLGDAAMPNLLRAVLGNAQGVGADRVVSLESNLDDLVPEHFDYLMERLFEAGALDVSLQHLQMKKNRPGFLVRVLARPADRELLASLLFAESTAIGVRVGEWDRIVLEREQRRVVTR
jgi:uncharacterized protein (TIGR00299 family) protein